MGDASERFLINSRFWIQRVLVPIAVLIGVGGNIVSVIVLTRRRMRSSTNVYLTALAVADLIYLFFVLILSFEHYPNIHDIKYNLFWRFYGISHWFCDAASSTSVWLTVSFTIERYVAVCHPIRGKVLCTERRAKTIIWAISLLCFIFTATTPLEYQLRVEQRCVQKTCDNFSTNNPVQRELKPITHDKEIINTNNLSTNFKQLPYSHDNFTVESANNSLKAEEPEIGKSLDLVNVIGDEGYGDRLAHYKDYNETMGNNIKHKTEIQYDINYKNGMSNKDSNITDVSNIILSTNRSGDVIQNEISNDTNDTIGGRSSLIPSKSPEPNTNQNNLNVNFTDANFTTNMEEEDVPSLTSTNETCCLNVSYIDTELTKLGKNLTYRTVYYWFSSIAFGLLPLVLIATFNCFLVSAVYRSQKQRKVMTNSQEQMSQSQENRITLLLIGVVFLFLVCQTPTASFLIYDAFDDAKEPYTSSWNIKKGLGNIFNFLCTLNASCNFILYCVLSDKFRRTFRIVFCSRGLSRQDTLITLTGSRSASQRFHSQRNLIKRGTSEYTPRTPRNLETQSLNSIPRTKSLLQRQLGKARTHDLNV